MNNQVDVICYGDLKTYTDRSEAIKFYMDCICNSEGAERDRYTNILMGLQFDRDSLVVTDGSGEMIQSINGSKLDHWMSYQEYVDKQNKIVYYPHWLRTYQRKDTKNNYIKWLLDSGASLQNAKERADAHYDRPRIPMDSMARSCKYCGRPNGSSDGNVLCMDCQATFGHIFYSDL